MKITDDGRTVFASSGRIMGVVAMATLAFLLVVALVPDSGLGWRTAVVLGLLGVVVWTVMLRPRVWITEEALVLRNPLETVELPLAALTGVAVRQVLHVFVDDERFTSPAINRTVRQLMRADRPAGPEQPMAPGMVDQGGRRLLSETAGFGKHDLPYADAVENAILQGMEDARARAGLRRGETADPEQVGPVVRRPAVPEIVLLVAGVLAGIAAFVV